MKNRRSLFLFLLIIPLLLLASCASDDTCPHEYGSFQTVKVATCTENGIVSRTCALCGEEEVTEVVALPHEIVTLEAVEPSCTSTGKTLGEACAVCATVITPQNELPMLEHTPKAIPAKAATCTAEGATDGLLCAVCELVLTEPERIPMLDHTYTTSTVAPTCGSEGYTLYKCTCGDEHKKDVKKANGMHTFTPNSNNVGYYCKTCKLQAIEYGNADGSMAGGNNKVKYYITGPSSETPIPRTLVIYGTGKMPDFSATELPMWFSSTYIHEVTTIIIEEGITSIGKYAFNKTKYENPYDNVKTFIVRNSSIRVSAYTDPLTGISCKVTYE